MSTEAPVLLLSLPQNCHVSYQNYHWFFYGHNLNWALLPDKFAKAPLETFRTLRLRSQSYERFPIEKKGSEDD